MWPEFAEAQPSMTNHFSKQGTSMAIRLAVLIYGTVMLELTIHRNHVQSGDDSWGFGQTVAVVIALAGFNEVLHFMLGYEWENVTEIDERRNSTYHGFSPRHFGSSVLHTNLPCLSFQGMQGMCLEKLANSGKSS